MTANKLLMPLPASGNRSLLRWVPQVVAGLLLFSVIEKISSFTGVPFTTGINIQVDTCLEILLLAFEVALAIMLVVEDRNPAIIRVAFGLFVIYTVYLFFNYLVFRRSTCGCGAGEQLFVSRTSKFVFSLLRNLAVLVLLRLYYLRQIPSASGKGGPEFQIAPTGL